MIRRINILFRIYIKSIFSIDGFKLVFKNLHLFIWKNSLKADNFSENINYNDRINAIHAAANWLLIAQQAMPDEGFGSYKIYAGWTSSYPETTGYILPTLIEYAVNYEKNEIFDNVRNAADWLLNIQKPSGGWQGGYFAEHQPEVVFNTGQILRGLIVIYNKTKEEKYLNAAIKSGKWLCSVQHPEGYWDEFTYKNIVRVFDSYVDVPLIELSILTNDNIFKNAAIKNIDWILNHKQHENGWFSDCENDELNNETPILHTIAYTIDGILDSGLLLNNTDYIDAATKTADALLRVYIEKGFLHGRYNKCWEKAVNFSILTGCAQIAIIWLKLFKITFNKTYFEESIKLNSFLIEIQKQSFGLSRNIEGALPGSFPIWAKYEPFSYPNWATKYFLDSLMLEAKIMKDIENKPF